MGIPTCETSSPQQQISNIDWDLNFGELREDGEFVLKCENLVEQLSKVQKTLDKVIPLKAHHYDKLPLNQQIELDLFLVYTLNSLWWIYLRISGTDMRNHPLKREFQRIKAVMVRWKEVKERKLRPTVDIEAARRFVRSGLYDHKQNGNDTPPNKKIKFDDSDE